MWGEPAVDYNLLTQTWRLEGEREGHKAGPGAYTLVVEQDEGLTEGSVLRLSWGNVDAYLCNNPVNWHFPFHNKMRLERAGWWHTQVVCSPHRVQRAQGYLFSPPSPGVTLQEW